MKRDSYFMKKSVIEYLFILIASALYGLATILFIFPHSLLLGGVSGVAVILEEYLPILPGTILMIINFSLIVIAFLVLGGEMAVKTLFGSTFTTLSIGIFEKILPQNLLLIHNIYLSSVIGALLIAIASGIMFYVKSSSGGTDIIALIVKKYSKLNIGKAVFVTDILIVVLGGFLSGITLLISSFLGFLVKVCGINFVIDKILKRKLRNI